MTSQLKKLIARLQSCDEGATLVEYGIALGIAVTVAAGALLTLGGDVNTKFTDAKDAVNQTPVE